MVELKTMKINTTQTYNLTEIISKGLFPGAKTKITARRAIAKDLAKGKKSILKTKIEGIGVRTTYQITGENLLAYKEYYDNTNRGNKGDKKVR